MVNRGGREGARRWPAPLPGLRNEPSARPSAGREGTEPPLPVPATPCPAEPGWIRHRFGWHREPGQRKSRPGTTRTREVALGHRHDTAGHCLSRTRVHLQLPGSGFPFIALFPPNFAACQRHRPEQGCPTRPHCATSPGRGPGAELTPNLPFLEEIIPFSYKNHCCGTALCPETKPPCQHRPRRQTASAGTQRHGK